MNYKYHLNSSNKIVILGPESTGKTTLAKFLANHYKTKYLPEYARYYVQKLNRNYNYKDVCYIYHKQLELETKIMQDNQTSIVFIDTDLIIIKIWFDVVFKKMPISLHKNIFIHKSFLYLLCFPDLAWKKDKVRENGGEMRNILFDKYKTELEYYNCNYKIISGTGDKRFQNAIDIIEKEKFY